MNIDKLKKAIKEGSLEDKVDRRPKSSIVFDEMEVKDAKMPGSDKPGKVRIDEEETEIVYPKAKGSLMPLKAGGKVSSASKRADGCAIKGKTRGRMV